jgi:hypothetical protein
MKKLEKKKTKQTQRRRVRAGARGVRREEKKINKTTGQQYHDDHDHSLTT